MYDNVYSVYVCVHSEGNVKNFIVSFQLMSSKDGTWVIMHGDKSAFIC